MKPEQINALKAGVKTAVITFLTGLVAVALQLLSALQSAVAAGNPPDLSFMKGALFAAVVALAVGVLNALVRFIQTIDVPLLTKLFDGLLGSVPKYTPQDPPKGD